MERIQAEYKFMKVSGDGDLVGFIEAGTFTVAEVYAHSPGNFAVQEANAEFIVRACNSHDQLVMALQRCLIRIEEECADPAYLDCVISAREALSAAGEQS